MRRWGTKKSKKTAGKSMSTKKKMLKTNDCKEKSVEGKLWNEHPLRRFKRSALINCKKFLSSLTLESIEIPHKIYIIIIVWWLLLFIYHQIINSVLSIPDGIDFVLVVVVKRLFGAVRLFFCWMNNDLWQVFDDAVVCVL